MYMSQVCQSVPAENGNNVSFSANPLYKYDAVINNYTDDEFYKVCQTINKYCKKAIVGKEVGDSGTPHLQIYLSLIKKQRITAITKWEGFERASLRACRNEDALINYCKKDCVAFSKGFPKPIKIIDKLYDWQLKIEQIYHTEPDDRKVYWFYETKGNIGKSAFVKYMVVKYGCLFCDGGKKSDLINLVFNANMDVCKCIIWDLPRSSKGSISYATLESIKNGMICNTKYETGTLTFNSPHIFVFANFPPDKPEELSSDRWVIEEL